MNNILIVNLGMQYGGAEKSIETTIKYIDKCKFSIYCIVRKNSEFDFSIKKAGERYVKKIVEVDLKKTNIIKIIKQIENVINDNKINLIHTHGITSTLLALLANRSKLKLVTTIHGYSDMDRMDRCFFQRKLFLIIEKYVFKKVDMCIAVSKDIKTYIEEKGGKDIRIINNGIELNDFCYCYKKNHSENKIIQIGSVGRLETVKGYDVLIKALKKCVDRGFDNFYCKIAGQGIQREYLEEIIKENNLQEKCELIGFIDNVNNFNRKLDIYIQPSLIESFGISIVEAMACNLPVIATASGGILDIVEDDINGITFNKNDSEDLASKIIYLAKNFEKRSEISQKAVEDVYEKFRIEDKVVELEKLYLNIL